MKRTIIISAALLALTAPAHASSLRCIMTRESDGLRLQADWSLNSYNKAATLGTFAEDRLQIGNGPPIDAAPGKRPIWIAETIADGGMSLRDRDGHTGSVLRHSAVVKEQWGRRRR
jgi:hypothetical protein